MQKCQLDIEMIQSTKYLTCVDVVMITVLCACSNETEYFGNEKGN